VEHNQHIYLRDLFPEAHFQTAPNLLRILPMVVALFSPGGFTYGLVYDVIVARGPYGGGDATVECSLVTHQE